MPRSPKIIYKFTPSPSLLFSDTCSSALLQVSVRLYLNKFKLLYIYSKLQNVPAQPWKVQFCTPLKVPFSLYGDSMNLNKSYGLYTPTVNYTLFPYNNINNAKYFAGCKTFQKTPVLNLTDLLTCLMCAWMQTYFIWLSGSCNLLYNGYRELFPGGKTAGAWRPLTSN
jgi:hypothetical protein